MPECLEVNGVTTTSPDCHCHAIRADVGVKGTERPSLCCSNANISQSLVNRYTINMDPLKGAGARMLPQGPKGHGVGSKKSNVDPFRSLLIEFCYLQQPCPPNRCFQHPHVSI